MGIIKVGGYNLQFIANHDNKTKSLPKHKTKIIRRGNVHALFGSFNHILLCQKILLYHHLTWYVIKHVYVAIMVASIKSVEMIAAHLVASGPRLLMLHLEQPMIFVIIS